MAYSMVFGISSHRPFWLRGESHIECFQVETYVCERFRLDLRHRQVRFYLMKTIRLNNPTFILAF